MKTEEKDPKDAPFKARRIKRTYIQKINSTPEKIFPLLCPKRQLEWLDGWNYQMVYSESEAAEKDAIFKTKYEEANDTIWVITNFDSENYVAEFVRVTPGVVVVKINILLADNFNGTTDVHYEYIFTALGPRGNDYIEGKSAKQFLDMMQWWEKSMNYYLESGRKLIALKLNKKKEKSE